MVTIKLSDIGMVSGVKNLYQSKPDKHGRVTWVDVYPDDLEEAVQETARFALIVRNVKAYDGRRQLLTQSIVVHSPLLKDFLQEVLGGYPGVTTGINNLTFDAPFKPFVHRWKQLKIARDEVWKDLNDQVQQSNELQAKQEHVDLLFEVLNTELKDVEKTGGGSSIQ